MSLRTRLTLLYSAVIGGVLLLSGGLVYGLVRAVLIRQVDVTLTRSFEEILTATRVVDAEGRRVIQLPPLDMASGVYVQAWTLDGRLSAQSSNLDGMTRPLDVLGLSTATPVFRDVSVGAARLRVLSVPLQLGEHTVGVLQVAARRNEVDAALRVLLTVLGATVLSGILFGGLLVGWATRRSLAPLDAVTRTALRITRADDLSSRIPYHGPPHDEIGQLVVAFNRTLGRLEALFEAQRRFVADVSHELRTPLTVIKGNVDLMRRLQTFDEEALASIEGEIDRLTRLVNDLLTLARAESGRLPLQLTRLDLSALTLDVVAQMSVLARQQDVRLRVGDVVPAEVCADADRMKQVLLNILGNALKYTPAGGEVTVSLQVDATHAWVHIADTGPGIPPEDVPHVFERFYRAEKARTRDGSRGFGLGLSIAYWIVRNHGGDITLDSSLGAGTTFHIQLPLATTLEAGRRAWPLGTYPHSP